MTNNTFNLAGVTSILAFASLLIPDQDMETGQELASEGVATAVHEPKEIEVSDKPNMSEFASLWAERFGPQRTNKEIYETLEYETGKPHEWNFSDKFQRACPKLTTALLRSQTFDVSCLRFEKLERSIICFWRAEDGAILAWILNPPVSDAAVAAADCGVPSLGEVWQHFAGFHRVRSWYMCDRDLPIAARSFDGLLDAPAERIDLSDAFLFAEMCDDKDFQRRLLRMHYVGDDPGGNYLVVEPKTELLFLLSRDGDEWGRRGASTSQIGTGDTSVYIFDGAETPIKMLEFCADHVLKQLPKSEDTGKEAKE